MWYSIATMKYIVLTLLAAYLLGGPQMAECKDARSDANQEQGSKDKKAVPPTHVIIEEPLPTIRTDPKGSDTQDKPQEKPLPRFLRPEWVIVYITAIYVFIAGLTLGAIWRQANLMESQIEEMRRQAKDQNSILERSVGAAETGATAAKNSADVLVNTERARLFVWLASEDARLKDLPEYNRYT